MERKIVSALFVSLCLSSIASAQLVTSLFDEETDLVVTGGDVISAVHFQNPDNQGGGIPFDPIPFVFNGITHIVGQGNEPLLDDNTSFEGDFRNGASGLPQDGSDIVQRLLSGIGGANGYRLDISGLTAGTDYLFQAYWEDDRGATLFIDIEGVRVANGVTAVQDRFNGMPGGTLISYEFTATDDVLNTFFDRDDSLPGDPNNWLSGYSLQVVPSTGGDLLGDYNDDGTVDLADYTIWRNNLGTSTTLPNDDIGGVIGEGQYTQWRGNFGAPNVPQLTVTAVPEPSTVVLLAGIAGLALVGLRQRNR